MWNPIVAALGAALLTSSSSSSVTTTAPTAPAATTCEETVAAPRRLRIYIVRGLPADVLPHARREIEEIWRPYQIEIEWMPPGLSLTDRPDLLVTLASRMLVANTPNRRYAIAWIVFHDGAPTNFIRVSWDAAVALLQSKTVWDELPISPMYPSIRDMALGRIVGRALAHEIGHFLLASNAHSSSGLMRAVIPDNDLVTPGRGKMRLRSREQRALHAARLAACEALARSATSPP